MENTYSEENRFQQYRRIDGSVESLSIVRHNRRPALQFPSGVTELPVYTNVDESPEYRELVDEVCQNLNQTERRTWMKIIDGRSILDIAQEEDVSRQAIYDRITRMTAKNEYVAIWWRLKNKVNQHK